MSCACPGADRKGCPCDRCHGAGWHPEEDPDFPGDYREAYCPCPAGDRLRERDNPR